MSVLRGWVLRWWSSVTLRRDIDVWLNCCRVCVPSTRASCARGRFGPNPGSPLWGFGVKLNYDFDFAFTFVARRFRTLRTFRTFRFRVFRVFRVFSVVGGVGVWVTRRFRTAGGMSGST